MRKVLILVAIVLVPVGAVAQPAGWNDPFPPHQVMDNLYYVGTSMLGSFLITTDEGHILVNGGYETTVPVIQAGVEELGFDFEDVEIFISVHAHPDHAEADALIKELTGAQVVTSRLEAPDLRTYGPEGTEHPIDRMLDDGDTITLGDTTLTAILMPGHTKGCTAFSLELEENGETYSALIECSLNGQFVQLVGNDAYPNIVEDFRATYDRSRALPVDLWVSSHGVFYGLDEKYERLAARGPGDPNPFVDPEGYIAHVDEYRGTFEASLERQLSEAGTGAPRLPNGRINLGGESGEDGLWFPFNGGGERVVNPNDIDEAAAAQFPDRPAVDQIPFQPWARQIYDVRVADRMEPHTRCKPSPGPRQFLTPYGVEILEVPDQERIFIFDVGGPHTYRIIYMDVQEHPADLAPSYYGHSIGRWDGDTLVVDTVGFNERFWMDRTGLPHTEELRMVERFTRTDADTMTYELIVDDPGAYTDVWTTSMLFAWTPETSLFEYVCQDNNMAPVLMSGDTRDAPSRIVP